MIRLLVAMLLLAGLGACAPPPSYTSMVPELATAELGPGPAPSYRGAITVAPVSVGTDTSLPWTSQIGAAEFQEALVRTLMLANLAAAQNGRFRLEAILLRLERPYAGFAMTVTASIAYRLTEIATGAVVYQGTRTSRGHRQLERCRHQHEPAAHRRRAGAARQSPQAGRGSLRAARARPAHFFASNLSAAPFMQ